MIQELTAVYDVLGGFFITAFVIGIAVMLGSEFSRALLASYDIDTANIDMNHTVDVSTETVTAVEQTTTTDAGTDNKTQTMAGTADTNSVTR